MLESRNELAGNSRPPRRSAHRVARLRRDPRARRLCRPPERNGHAGQPRIQVVVLTRRPHPVLAVPRRHPRDRAHLEARAPCCVRATPARLLAARIRARLALPRGHLSRVVRVRADSLAVRRLEPDRRAGTRTGRLGLELGSSLRRILPGRDAPGPGGRGAHLPRARDLPAAAVGCTARDPGDGRALRGSARSRRPAFRSSPSSGSWSAGSGCERTASTRESRSTRRSTASRSSPP